MSETSGPILTLQDLPELRRKTDGVAQLLKNRFTTYLETLRPLFAPERLLGKHAGGKNDVPGADRVLAELQQAFKPFVGKPYDLPTSFEGSWLTLVGNLLELQPWEYTVTIQGRTINMSSPVKWVLAFRSTLPTLQAKALLSGKEVGRRDELRQVVVNALVLQSILHRNPSISELFHDLRFEIRAESVADLPGLPVTTVNACLQSFRPPDDLVLTATAFSGVPSFIELLDPATAAQPRDFLRERLSAVLS